MIFVLLLVLVITFVFIVIAIDRTRAGLAPAISTPQSALKEICLAMSIKQNDEVWELGCGDARVICYCAKQNPKSKFIGIENGIIMLLKAKWRTRKISNIKIRFGNFKNIKLDTASKMYLYLLPQALNIIEPSIPKGCKVVSLEFELPTKQLSKVVRLKNPSRFAHKLFVYNT